MDLVEVAPNAKPPVCKVMDMGKFLYEQEKKRQKARKSQKIVEVSVYQKNILIIGLNSNGNAKKVIYGRQHLIILREESGVESVI